MQHLSEFVLNHWILVATFCTLLGVLAANLLMTVGGISTLEAVTLINRESAVVIDVRSVEDFASGHIIDAIHLPLTALAGASDKLKKYASKPLLVYCASGNLAGQAVKARLHNESGRGLTLSAACVQCGTPLRRGSGKTQERGC